MSTLRPSDFADPSVREFFDAYIFASLVAAELLEQVRQEYMTEEFGELVGMTSHVGMETAKLLKHINDLRLTQPAVYRLWIKAVEAAREVN